VRESVRSLGGALHQPDERHLGKFRGIVTDTDDPAKSGRLRARVPEVLADVETGWALPCIPYAGEAAGLWAVPPVGSGVWIEFEGGDASRPVWTGCWWAEGKAPADSVQKVVLRTPAGHLVRIDDEAGTIELEEKGGGRIAMASDSITLESNGAKVVLDASGVEISAGGKKVTVGSASVSVNDGALEVT
jgi:phage baseplate assembly protein gpV